MSELPLGWVTARVGDIAEVRLGRQRSPDKAIGAHMRPYLRAANVTWSGLDLSDVKEMNFEPQELGAYALRKGDILLGEASGSQYEVGKPAVFNGEIADCCFQNTLIRVRAPAEVVPFLYQHFTYDARTGAFARASRGIGIHHLGAEAISNWAIAMPPLPEQRRIAHKIEVLTSRSRRAQEALGEIPTLLERFRQSVLAAAFRGDLTAEWRAQNPDVEPADKLLMRIRAERRRRWEEAELAKMRAKGKVPGDDRWKAKYEEPTPVDAEGLPELPEGWVAVELGDVVWRLTNGYVGPTRDIYVEQGVPYLLSKHVKKNALRFDGETFITEEFNQRNRKSILKAGDVLLVQTGHVGESAVVPPEHEGHNCHAMIVISPVEGILDGNYLSLFFGAPATQLAFGAIEKGMTLRHLNCHDVIHLPTAVPPLAEQRLIVERVQAQLDRIARVARGASDQMEALASLDRAILAKAFRGELVPQEPSEEPASVLLDRLRAERAQASAPSNRGRGKKRKDS